MNVYALLKFVTNEEGVDEFRSILGVYDNLEELEQRVRRIASANSDYPMIRLSPTKWRIGPDEYEGFFGNRPVTLQAAEAHHYPALLT